MVFAVLLDDPTLEARAGLEVVEMMAKPGEIVVKEAPFPALAGGVERFMELRQIQLDMIRGRHPAYGVIWDDDHVLADVDEAKAVLADQPDLVYASKLFLWDSQETYNDAMPQHRSVFFFRMLEGDQFPLDRTIHAPARIHDTASKVVDLQAPLLDHGYRHQKDREKIFKEYVRVGKIDAATVPLVEPPTLKKVTWESIAKTL